MEPDQSVVGSLVLAQASAAPIDRAVVTGTRKCVSLSLLITLPYLTLLFSFARTSGGALGLAASNAILNNLFQKNLPPNLPADLRARVLDSVSDMPADLDPSTRDAILDAYNSAIHWVFVYFAPVIGVCFLLSFFMVVSPYILLSFQVWVSVGDCPMELASLPRVETLRCL